MCDADTRVQFHGTNSLVFFLRQPDRGCLRQSLSYRCEKRCN